MKEKDKEGGRESDEEKEGEKRGKKRMEMNGDRKTINGKCKKKPKEMQD